MAALVAIVRCVAFASLLAAPGTRASVGCPRDVGFAINTGDEDHHMSRVKFILGTNGWAGQSDYAAYITSRRTASDWFPSQVVVYSSTRTFSLPLGDGTATIPVTPCCGGRDYSTTIADAQRMREHTWRLMLDQFPAETRWFVSTEDDVWWDLQRLCEIIDDSIETLGAADDEPVVIGGGQPDRRLLYGPYVILNRPALELFANKTLMTRCRRNIVHNNSFLEYVYPGAQYNLDHLTSYCLFECFPAVTGRTIYTDVKQAWPMKSGKRPEFFYHNGDAWQSSLRAACFLRDLMKHHRDEEIVALHHTTIEDMAFMQRQRRLYEAAQLDKNFAPNYLKHLKRACRSILPLKTSTHLLNLSSDRRSARG